MPRISAFFPLTVALAVLGAPAFAQYGTDNPEMYDRLDRLERDMMTLQRQVARSGGAPAVGGMGADMPEGGTPQLAVQLSSMEEELRGLRGKLEENEFQIRRLNDAQAKFQRDVEFRLNALEAGHNGPPNEAAPGAPKNSLPDGVAAEIPPGESDAKGGAGPANAPEPENFGTAREHYNYAFRLMNQTRYEDAARYFTSFTKKYPKDPLIGNAYYWLGETYYIRRDYVKAADNFRAGFEALPAGPKAADNLLKLSMSLSAMQRTKDACVVLDQLRMKFKERAPSVVQKAESEYTRIGCK
ncbi:MAG: tol-pal system protein YbgF [Alphaproteobacteria bacterium]|nr:tol-pal system protein YbgF [Alphaproteobacteria bacterium]